MNLFIEKQTDFTWINEPDVWTLEDGKLKVQAPANSDFFIDEEGPIVRDSAPYFYINVKGDFALTTRVNVDMNFTYDSACLMIMGDDRTWAKICYENWLDEPAIVSVVTKKTSDDCPSYKIGNVIPYLKVLRSDNNFGFHYSLDGKSWTIIRYFNLEVGEEIKVGVAAQCPVGKGCDIEFEFFEFEQVKIESAKKVE